MWLETRWPTNGPYPTSNLDRAHELRAVGVGAGLAARVGFGITTFPLSGSRLGADLREELAAQEDLRIDHACRANGILTVVELISVKGNRLS